MGNRTGTDQTQKISSAMIKKISIVCQQIMADNDVSRLPALLIL
jgi:hypothetical protein